MKNKVTPKKNQKIYEIKQVLTRPKNIDCGIKSMNFYLKEMWNYIILSSLIEHNAVHIDQVSKGKIHAWPTGRSR